MDNYMYFEPFWLVFDIIRVVRFLKINKRNCNLLSHDYYILIRLEADL